jgi:hypothetical protein
MMSVTDTFTSSDFYVLTSGKLRTSDAVYVEGDTFVGPIKVQSQGTSNDEIRGYTLPSTTYELLCEYILKTLGENLKKFFNHNVDFLSAVSSSTRKSLLEASVLHEFPQSHEFDVLPKEQNEGYIYFIFSGKCALFVNGEKVATLLRGQVFHDCDLDTNEELVSIKIRPVKGEFL